MIAEPSPGLDCFCGLEHGFLWYPVGGRYESDFVAGFKVRWLNSFFALRHFLFYHLSIINNHCRRVVMVANDEDGLFGLVTVEA